MNKNIEVRLLSEKEYGVWDAFVNTSKQGCIFNYSWWLNAVTEKDFEILVIMRDNKIVFGMPLPFYSTGTIQKPKLTQTLGVLFAPFETNNLDKILEIQKNFTNLALEFLKERINSYRMYFHSMYDYWLPFRWKDYKQTTRYTYRILYNNFESYDKIWSNYSSNKRRNINRGFKLGVKIEESEDFETFFELNKATFSRQNISVPYTYNFFKNLDSAIAAYGRRVIVNAIINDTVIASAYFIYDDNCSYYLASGVNLDYRDYRAQDLLIDYGIKQFYKKVNIFDFEGSMIESIEKNFRAFGATPTQYFEIRNDI